MCWSPGASGKSTLAVRLGLHPSRTPTKDPREERALFEIGSGWGVAVLAVHS